jgi:integrase
VRRFQLYLVEGGASICNRNRIMTGVRFLFRVTLRRHDLANEIWRIKEPQKLPPVLSPEEVKRVLAMATSLKARAMLTLSYGCGLRASEVARLRAGDIAGDIDSKQMIIRIVQSKGRKDRHLIDAATGDPPAAIQFKASAKPEPHCRRSPRSGAASHRRRLRRRHPGSGQTVGSAPVIKRRPGPSASFGCRKPTRRGPRRWR